MVEVSERIDAFGEVVVPLDRDGVLRAAEGLLAQGVETLAVSFLWSHLNAAHEEAAQELLDERYPDLYVSYGSLLAQRIGEYPRAATAVLNSYIGPLMRDYVTHAAQRAGRQRLQRPPPLRPVRRRPDRRRGRDRAAR